MPVKKFKKVEGRINSCSTGYLAPLKIMPKIETVPEYFEEPKVEINKEDYEKRQERIKIIDEKITEAAKFYQEYLPLFNKLPGDVVNDLRVINENLMRLVPLVDDFEINITKWSHFCDRLGDFVSVHAMIKRILTKSPKQELVDRCFEKVNEYRNYFSECVTNQDFLKTELGSTEGKKYH